MAYWKDKVVFVTGAGSGIGRALCLAAAKRGARIVATDVDGDAAARTAEACGGGATSARLDVRDAEAFKVEVDRAAERHERFDVLVNNAGIGMGGEVQELTAAHFDRIIDINIKGVVHGVLAAYPRFVAQRSGHVVNVASLAGLAPTPLLAPYGMSKHAVVGLSTSLRVEGAAYGVKCSVLCPAAIETPILDSENPADLPRVSWRPDVRRFLTTLAGPPHPVEALAEEALDGVAANRAVIVIPRRARLAWWVGSIFPGVVEKASRDAVAVERSHRPG